MSPLAPPTNTLSLLLCERLGDNTDLQCMCLQYLGKQHGRVTLSSSRFLSPMILLSISEAGIYWSRQSHVSAAVVFGHR